MGAWSKHHFEAHSIRAASKRVFAVPTPTQKGRWPITSNRSTENAFSDYGKPNNDYSHWVRQSESDGSATPLASIQYREGTADFLVLLEAERERLAAEDTQAQAQAEIEVYPGILTIYKSLSGGWSYPAGQVVSP